MDAARTPAPTRAPRAIARIEHSEALLAALRRRLVELNITHEVVDYLGGFQLGYCSKLLSNPPVKRLGHFSLFALLEVLALDIVLVENPERLETLKNPAHLRRQRFLLKRPAIQIFAPDFLRLNGSKGGRARARNLSPKQLSRIGKRGARARWARVRASAAASPPAPASP
jgi:hypothetical protein